MQTLVSETLIAAAKREIETRLRLEGAPEPEELADSLELISRLHDVPIEEVLLWISYDGKARGWQLTSFRKWCKQQNELRKLAAEG